MGDIVKVFVDTKGTGIYCLGFNDDSSGMRLYKVLTAKSVFNKDILCITYDKFSTESTVVQKIQEFNGKILMLHRLNLYYTEKIGEALSKTNCIVLIDLKDNRKLREMPIKLARVKDTAECIEVREV